MQSVTAGHDTPVSELPAVVLGIDRSIDHRPAVSTASEVTTATHTLDVGHATALKLLPTAAAGRAWIAHSAPSQRSTSGKPGAILRVVPTARQDVADAQETS
jgi:hypothetical protein